MANQPGDRKGEKHKKTWERLRAGRLTFAGGEYARTQAFIYGTIKPDGIELDWQILRYPEIWRRMLRH